MNKERKDPRFFLSGCVLLLEVWLRVLVPALVVAFELDGVEVSVTWESLTGAVATVAVALPGF